MNYYTIARFENGETKVVRINGVFPSLFETYEEANTWRLAFAGDNYVVITLDGYRRQIIWQINLLKSFKKA